MNCQTNIEHPNTHLALDSTLIEKALEYQLTGAIMAGLLTRGQRYEVLHGVCDRDGYDVVIEAAGIMRHIQLKASVEGGKNDRFGIHSRLATKPSGCAIWIIWGRDTVQPMSFRFFGSEPGQPLPDIGNRISRHSRGKKAQRPAHRDISTKRFEPMTGLDMLIDRLFGPAPDPARSLLLANMTDVPDFNAEPWLAAIRAGSFAARPDDLDWASSAGLAHLIDGYSVVSALGHADADIFLEQQLALAARAGTWPGSVAALWATLFLEHRRWRFADPFEPDEKQHVLLDRLVAQLISELGR